MSLENLGRTSCLSIKGKGDAVEMRQSLVPGTLDVAEVLSDPELIGTRQAALKIGALANHKALRTRFA